LSLSGFFNALRLVAPDADCLQARLLRLLASAVYVSGSKLQPHVGRSGAGLGSSGGGGGADLVRWQSEGAPLSVAAVLARLT
jgi:hypothetical protein